MTEYRVWAERVQDAKSYEEMAVITGEAIARIVELETATDRLTSYILDGQVRRLDRDVLRSLAEAARSDNQHLSNRVEGDK